MATPVKDIFEPRPTKIGQGSYLTFSGRGGPATHILHAYNGDALLISIVNGMRWGRPVTVNDICCLTLEEVGRLVLADQFPLEHWSVLSRAEAAAELAKMK